MSIISTLEELEAIYGLPAETATVKVANRVTPHYLLTSFAVDGKAPRSVVVIAVEAVYFQCARALVRSDLWNPEKQVEPKSLPSAGQMLAALSENRVGGEDYDRAWGNRAKETLW
jgi:predicted pyridoxine 5'-phosphate oxidase superfamily flavin-nucleotide-binding protein